MPDSRVAATCVPAPPAMAGSVGFDDAFTKIDICRVHNAAVGPGADDAERFIR